MSLELSPDGQTITRKGLPAGWYASCVSLGLLKPQTDLADWLTASELEQIMKLVRASASKAEVIAHLEEQIRKLKG